MKVNLQKVHKLAGSQRANANRLASADPDPASLWSISISCLRKCKRLRPVKVNFQKLHTSPQFWSILGMSGVCGEALGELPGWSEKKRRREEEEEEEEEEKKTNLYIETPDLPTLPALC